MKKIVLLVIIIMSNATQASTLNNTKITRLMNDRSYLNFTFIQATGAPNRDGGHCHTNGTWDFVLNTDDSFGKQMHAQLLAAFAAGKTVELHGTDSCPIGNAEELRRIEIY